MKKVKILSFLMGLATLFAACENNENEGPEGPEPHEQVGHTASVYIMGDNGVSESPSPFKVSFSDTKVGMEEVNYSKCNSIVYSETVNDVSHLISLKQKNGKIVAGTPLTYDEQNPLGKEVMANVISQTVSYFLADSYGLIFLSHSSSWVPTNNNANSRSAEYYRRTQMNISDFREALSSASPKPLKFILFGSYDMQSVEIAYELHDCAEYFIGSPAETPGPGVPYEAVVPGIFTEANLATNIAEAYYGYYKKSYTGVAPVSNENWTGGVAISVIKSTALDNLTATTKTITPKYIQEKREVDHNGILAYDSNDDANYDFEKLIRNLTGGVDNMDYRS